jgi:hypothetical protein
VTCIVDAGWGEIDGFLILRHLRFWMEARMDRVDDLLETMADDRDRARGHDEPRPDWY